MADNPFKPGERLFLRKGNSEEPVDFVEVSSTPLVRPKQADPSKVVEAYPGLANEISTTNPRTTTIERMVTPPE